jgi:hypothetical protein
MTTETLTNEMRALLALITNEWRPLPLAEIADITNCLPSSSGKVFRRRLGWREPPGSYGNDTGRVYIHDGFGLRLARCYRSSTDETGGRGSRYFWRRFHATASDAEIIADALTLTPQAHLFGSRPLTKRFRGKLVPGLFADHKPAVDAVSVAPVAAPPVAPAPAVVAEDIADQIAKARAELEQLEAVRRARIEALQAEIARLSSV